MYLSMQHPLASHSAGELPAVRSIDIESMSWLLDCGEDIGGSAGARVKVQLSRRVDEHSSVLIDFFTRNEAFPDLVIVAMRCETDLAGPACAMYEFGAATVENISHHAVATGSEMVETIVLGADRVTLTLRDTSPAPAR